MPFTSFRTSGHRSIAQSNEIELGPITVFIGANNSGKSSLLRSLLLIQEGSGFSPRDIRIGSPDAKTVLNGIWPIPQLGGYNGGQPAPGASVQITATGRPNGAVETSWTFEGNGQVSGGIAGTRPNHVVVPVLGNRKRSGFTSTIDRSQADRVGTDDSALTSRLNALSGNHAEGRRYRQLADQILGLEVSTHLGPQGSVPGIPVNVKDGIDLERMGEGVRNIVFLAAELADDQVPRLFLIEEPENDLHPAALAQVLKIIQDATSVHQFVVTTHSDVVLRALGAIEGTRIYETALDDSDLPSTVIRPIETPIERWEVLTNLGYETGLPLGWMIFEEASAETFVGKGLVPLFAPRLACLRTASSDGAGNVRHRVQAVRNLALFAHLSEDQHPPIWVLVDGDQAGDEAIRALRRDFDWPESRLCRLPREAIERFYPQEFQAKVSAIDTATGSAERSRLKGELANEVTKWAITGGAAAKDALAKCTLPIIEALQRIEADLGRSI